MVIDAGHVSAAKLADIVTEAVLDVARLRESLLHQLLNPRLRRGTFHGGKERFPFRCVLLRGMPHETSLAEVLGAIQLFCAMMAQKTPPHRKSLA